MCLGNKIIAGNLYKSEFEKETEKLIVKLNKEKLEIKESSPHLTTEESGLTGVIYTDFSASGSRATTLLYNFKTK